MNQGKYAEADKFYRQRISILRAAQQEKSGETDLLFTALHAFALLRRGQGDSKKAETIVCVKLAEMRRQNNSESPEFCGALTMFASILTEKGKYDEAENDLLEAETIYRKLYRETYLPLGDNLRIQAQTLYFQNKHSRSRS